MSDAAVSVSVLGPARITIDGAPAPSELLWRKHLALLVYLARSPRRARTRDHLIGLFWSERDEKSARHSLSEALRVFRRVLGDARVLADVDQVSLAEGAVALDCDELALRSAARDWAGAARVATGDFLEGLSVPDASEFENWLAGERLLWRTRSVEALTEWAEAQLAAAETAGAKATALRALALEPTAEAAARAAIRALALDGDRAGALALADRLTAALRDRLGTEPAPETRRLVDRVREARVGRRVVATPEGARPRAPLTGRAAELARLTAVWDRARGGSAGVVLLEGEPGEGKTRLLEEMVDRARLADATVAASRAVPSDAQLPWAGVVGLLSGGLAAAPGITGASGAALAVLGALAPDLDTKLPSGAAGAVEPAQALVAAVRAAASEQPVLLALDDAQDLDRETAAALPQLVRDVHDARVLVVVSAQSSEKRPEWLDALRAQIGRGFAGEVIRLGRLDHAAIGALARWWLPRYTAADIDRVVRRVERDSAGVALLASAMLEAVALGFRMTADAPAWPGERRTLVDSLPGDLPPAVVGAVCLRLRRTPEPAQTVLAAAASLGERFSAGELARATGLPLSEVEQSLDRLEWERWVAVDPRGYAFAAPIERAILLQEMVTPGQVRRYRERSAPAK
ncbi:MAG TPA: AAA family ATPase [Gemmatimonadales bacterium]|nr:AAA family ATPase [Gemmatimonadales bacterium]